MSTSKINWFAYWVVAIVAAGGTAGALLLLQNINQRKAEAKQTAFKLIDVFETTVDPKQWGKNFPRQYDSYLRTVDTQRTRHGGSEAFQKLDTDPHLKAIFDGYAFAIDYREERGHAYMLSDQRETERVTKKVQPGACVHCHASNTVAYRKLGVEKGAGGTIEMPFASKEAQAQLFKGFEEMCKMKFDDATKLVEHPVACIDCHDPDTMHLRVTKPGFLNGIRALAKSSDPVPHLPSIERWRKGDRSKDYDPNIEATRQEMRSMACGQCHVEYYFKGEGKLVTYPWMNGLKVEQVEKYYNDVGFSDWTHARSGAKVLKAQHPEFEMWSQGIHARSGVSCADCHMPYIREGAIKVSDHHTKSPLLNISRACQTCHSYSEEEISSRVAAIQDRTKKLLDASEQAVVDLISALEQAKKDGMTNEQLLPVQKMQRAAQWRCDFVNAENSMGFHAPQEAARILGESIDLARQGQIELLKMQTGKTSMKPTASAK